MEEVEAMCESICLIDHGRVVLSGSLREIKARYGRNTVVVEHGGGPGRLHGIPGVQACDDGGREARLRLEPTADPQRVMRAVLDRVEVASIRLDEPHIEDIYLAQHRAAGGERGGGELGGLEDLYLRAPDDRQAADAAGADSGDAGGVNRRVVFTPEERERVHNQLLAWAYRRGFDGLPEAIRNAAAGALVQSADQCGLLRALRHATNLLLSEGVLASVCAPQLATRLSEFAAMD
jgi:hypothetical protein